MSWWTQLCFLDVSAVLHNHNSGSFTGFLAGLGFCVCLFTVCEVFGGILGRKVGLFWEVFHCCSVRVFLNTGKKNITNRLQTGLTRTGSFSTKHPSLSSEATEQLLISFDLELLQQSHIAFSLTGWTTVFKQHSLIHRNCTILSHFRLGKWPNNKPLVYIPISILQITSSSMMFLWAMRSTWPATTNSYRRTTSIIKWQLTCNSQPSEIRSISLPNVSQATAHTICNKQATYIKMIFDTGENRSQAFHRSKPALKNRN